VQVDPSGCVVVFQLNLQTVRHMKSVIVLPFAVVVNHPINPFAMEAMRTNNMI